MSTASSQDGDGSRPKTSWADFVDPSNRNPRAPPQSQSQPFRHNRPNTYHRQHNPDSSRSTTMPMPMPMPMPISTHTSASLSSASRAHNSYKRGGKSASSASSRSQQQPPHTTNTASSNITTHTPTTTTTTTTQFQCLFTKHKTQKRKVWNDGRLVVTGNHGWQRRAHLHDANPPLGSTDVALDASDLALPQQNNASQDLIVMEKYLVQIEGPWQQQQQQQQQQPTKVMIPSSQSQNTNGGSFMFGGASSHHVKPAPLVSRSMQKILKTKFRKPSTNHIPSNPVFRQQQLPTHNRKRPMQPGELERRYYGPDAASKNSIHPMHHDNHHPPQHHHISQQPLPQQYQQSVPSRESSDPHQNPHPHPQNCPPQYTSSMPLNQSNRNDTPHSNLVVDPLGLPHPTTQPQLSHSRNRNPSHSMGGPDSFTNNPDRPPNNGVSSSRHDDEATNNSSFGENGFNASQFYGEDSHGEDESDDESAEPFFVPSSGPNNTNGNKHSKGVGDSAASVQDPLGGRHATPLSSPKSMTSSMDALREEQPIGLPVTTQEKEPHFSPPAQQEGNMRNDPRRDNSSKDVLSKADLLQLFASDDSPSNPGESHSPQEEAYNSVTTNDMLNPTTPTNNMETANSSKERNSGSIWGDFSAGDNDGESKDGMDENNNQDDGNQGFKNEAHETQLRNEDSLVTTTTTKLNVKKPIGPTEICRKSQILDDAIILPFTLPSGSESSSSSSEEEDGFEGYQ